MYRWAMVAGVGVLAVAATVYVVRGPDQPGVTEPVGSAVSTSTGPAGTSAPDAQSTTSPTNPAALAQDRRQALQPLPEASRETHNTASATPLPDAVLEALREADTLGDAPDPFTIGLQDWTDEALIDAAAHLRADPALLRTVMDEFRAETDPERLQRLVQLFREADVPGMTELARELVFSGNETSQLAALDLLQITQAFDSQAQAVLIDVLSSASNEAVLLRAMDASLKASGDQAMRAEMVSHLVPLAGHASARVRRSSLSTLSRWSHDPTTVTPLLIGGLSDADADVRKTAAYAFVDYRHTNADARQALLAVAEDSTESKRARRGAILALRRSTVSDDIAARLNAAERQLNIRRPNP